jgi:hypothetical protein
MSNLETVSNRLSDRELSDGSGVIVKNIAYGINLYKKTISKSDCKTLIASLEDELSYLGGPQWSKPEEEEPLRAALEFPISEDILGPKIDSNMGLYHIYDSAFRIIKKHIDDYASTWDIGIEKYEPLNFVKYSYPNNYFGLHTDHGPSTVRTVSAILYLNEDYLGGELHFPSMDGLTLKPETGDMIVFPSTYTYQHESTLMLQGTKYVVLAFTDFVERA